MPQLRIEKVSAPPVGPAIQPNRMYLIRNGAGFDMALSNNAGTEVIPLNAGVSTPTEGPSNDIESFLLMGVGNGN